MKVNLTSSTARGAATLRATHYAWEGAGSVFKDPLAEVFTSPLVKVIVRSSLLSWFVKRSFLKLFDIYYGIALGRAKFCEDQLREWLDNLVGEGVYIILGAGFDTFCLRSGTLVDNFKIIEVDHPATQRAKLKILSQNKMQKTAEFIPVDFEKMSLAEAMEPLDLGKMNSLISWLGVTYYLTEDAIRKTLLDLNKSVSVGSEIVMDYMDDEVLSSSSSWRLRPFLYLAAFRGEPLITGFSQERLESLVESCGYEIVENLLYEEQKSRLFSNSSLNPTPHFNLLRLRKKFEL